MKSFNFYKIQAYHPHKNKKLFENYFGVPHIKLELFSQYIIIIIFIYGQKLSAKFHLTLYRKILCSNSLSYNYISKYN